MQISNQPDVVALKGGEGKPMASLTPDELYWFLQVCNTVLWQSEETSPTFFADVVLA